MTEHDRIPPVPSHCPALYACFSNCRTSVVCDVLASGSTSKSFPPVSRVPLVARLTWASRMPPALSIFNVAPFDTVRSGPAPAALGRTGAAISLIPCNTTITARFAPLSIVSAEPSTPGPV